MASAPKHTQEYLNATRSFAQFSQAIEATRFPLTLSIAVPVTEEGHLYIVDRNTLPVCPEHHVVRDYVLKDFDGKSDEEVMIRQLHRHNYTPTMVGAAMDKSRLSGFRLSSKYGLRGIKGNHFHRSSPSTLIPDMIKGLTDAEAKDCLIDYIKVMFENKESEAAVLNERYGLTMKESRYLAHLLNHPDVICSKESLLNVVYADYAVDDWPEIKIVDVFIHKLRKKLKVQDVDFSIKTVWGEGYVLTFDKGADKKA